MNLAHARVHWFVPEEERIRPSSGPNRRNSGRVHVTYRALLRGWAFRPYQRHVVAAVSVHLPVGETPDRASAGKPYPYLSVGLV